MIRNIVKSIGFIGHGLGGAITQAQAMYFVSYPKYSKLKLSPCKTFEGYGIKASVAGVFKFDCYQDSYGVNFVLTCPAEAVSDVVKVATVPITIFTDNEMEKHIKDNYVTYQNQLDNGLITNFVRRGDLVANIAKLVGETKEIETDRYMAGATNYDFAFHAMTNFRYQGYTSDGSMLITQVNTSNVNTMKETKGVYTAEKYNKVFSGMSNYEKF